MIASYSARRPSHRLAFGLVAILPLLLAVCSFPVEAVAASKGSAAHAASPQKAAKRRSSANNEARELALKSNAALVIDQDTGEALAVKNPDVVLPVASLTKLMTGLVVVDAKLPLDEELEIGNEDVDTEKRTHSRLRVGTRLKREEMLLLALMSSENRAAMSLSRHYPGGRPAFLAQMNAKAKALGMNSTHFADPAGLSNRSVSTARDLHRLLTAAYSRPLLRRYSTTVDSTVRVGKQVLTYNNSNRLVRSSGNWNIELQKTGFTNEAGRCLVMQVNVMNRRLAMVFLDSDGTLTRYADAARVRRRIELDARNKPAPRAGASESASVVAAGSS